MSVITKYWFGPMYTLYPHAGSGPMSLGVDAALYVSSPANTVYPEYETPEPAPLAGSPRIPARTALQMPSAPMSTSPWTRSPLSRTAVTAVSYTHLTLPTKA